MGIKYFCYHPPPQKAKKYNKTVTEHSTLNQIALKKQVEI